MGVLAFFFGGEDGVVIVHEEDILEIFLMSPFALNGVVGTLFYPFFVESVVLGIFFGGKTMLWRVAFGFLGGAILLHDFL